MRVCDVVKDSVWYDPRVKKQLAEYVRNGVEVLAVGIKDKRYNEEEVKKLPCPVYLVDMYQKARGIVRKIKRETHTNKSIYRKILELKPDIIHANDLNALIPAYKAAKKLKCKLIYDTHEIFLENPWIARNKVIKFVWGFYEKRIIKKVDLVVCVSHAAGQYLQQKYKIKEPLVVTNCIRAEQRIENDTIKSEKKEILNHGQFYEGRGYDILVDTAPLLKKYADLEVVLRGFGTLEESLKEQARKNEADNLRFAPPVKVDELIPCSSKAWVGCAITEAISINFKLSVSNKIFEYAAAGLPVIMSDIPEHRYLNDKYNLGIILAKDAPEEIYNAIDALYNDEALYYRYAENAKRLSREINWENEFGKLLNIEYLMMQEKI